MKIELIYDPVGPATTVSIDGQSVDPTDMYGFLYPVRNCLLQTWLYPSGSWTGLSYQLREVARGDDVELIFYGRQEDYADVVAAVSSLDKITMYYHPWDSTEKYESTFQNIEIQLQNILDTGKASLPKSQDSPVKKTMAELYPEVVDILNGIQGAVPAQWFREIRTEEDYDHADQAALCCCIVMAPYLDSYEKLAQLVTLTRSMRRSKDMVCCCISDDEQRSHFSSYAAQYSSQTFCFVGKDIEVWKEKLYAKYGKAYRMRQNFYTYQSMLEVLEQCFRQREELVQRKGQLAKIQKPGIAEIRELERTKIKIDWFNRKTPYLEKIRELFRQIESAEEIRKEVGMNA